MEIVNDSMFYSLCTVANQVLDYFAKREKKALFSSMFPYEEK